MTSVQLDLDTFMEALGRLVDRPSLTSIASAELEFRSNTRQYKGYSAISNAFKSVVVRTVREFNGPWRTYAGGVSPLHTWLTVRLADNFHWICGAEHQALIGYPFPAMAQIRNIFDSAVVSSAVVQGCASMYEAEGYDPRGYNDPRMISRRRKSTEARINAQMFGSKSGMSVSAIEQMTKIDRLFDMETHGHRLSATRSTDWLKGAKPLPFLPFFTEDQIAAFMNRHLEAMWMVHRLLPFVRPHAAPLDHDLARQWQVLDDAIRRAIAQITEQLGKPFGRAFVEFTVTKFPFCPANVLSP